MITLRFRAVIALVVLIGDPDTGTRRLVCDLARRTFLSRPPCSPRRWYDASTMSPGLPVAHYRITTKLGRSGMGEVSRATDTEVLQMSVATAKRDWDSVKAWLWRELQRRCPANEL